MSEKNKGRSKLDKKLSAAAKARGVLGWEKGSIRTEGVEKNRRIRLKLGVPSLMNLGLEEWPSDSP